MQNSNFFMVKLKQKSLYVLQNVHCQAVFLALPK